MSDPSRDRAIRAFLDDTIGPGGWQLDAALADASFRRYYRVHSGPGHYVLMDAPPPQEDCRPFVEVAGRLRRAGIRAPRIHHGDLERGLLLLEDFGDVLYRDRIRAERPQPWFDRALATAEALALAVDPEGLPAYDGQRLGQELDLFPDWYLDGQLGAPLAPHERQDWLAARERLIDAALDQPRVFVHRDYHSCNLMDVDDGPPGVIDFQDAVNGPVSYDLISLLMDRYITWPRDRIVGWYDAFRRRVVPGRDPDRWVRDCDLMGLQRNLKVVGIFARLDARDGKPHYLGLQPRFLGYVLDALDRYPEFAPLAAILERRRCGR